MPCWSTRCPRNSTAAAENTHFTHALQAVLLKDSEDLPEVFLQGVAGDDDVVQVAKHEGEVFE